MPQVVLRLCAQLLGAWSCKTTAMLADPDNKASLAEGAIRLQLPLGVDYRAAVPPESSGARYVLVSAMRRALSTFCAIDSYRLLMRDLTPHSTPLANLGQHGLDPEGIGAYATFDVLPATGGGPSPESTARSLQLMLDDPTGASPFYHKASATSAARREAYDLFQRFPPVRGATLTQLAKDGTFSARIPPPSPPPPSPPPPREPPLPPRSPWAEAQHVVRLAFLLSGSVDTFDRPAFTARLAALLKVDTAAIALAVSAASVRVRATVNAESAEGAAALAAKVDALTPESASIHLGVTVESLEGAVACDASRGGSEKGCGGEVISTADEGGEVPVEYPPNPSPPPPREPPLPPRSPWAEAQHVVRLAFLLSGSVDTFDRPAFTARLAALLKVDTAAIALAVSAASVRVRATVNAESAEGAAALAAKVDALTPESASIHLGVTVESLEGAVACDASRGGSEKGCGGEGGEVPVEYIGGAAALVVALCVCAFLCHKRRTAQRAQEQKLRAAVNVNQKKMAQMQVAMRDGGMM